MKRVNLKQLSPEAMEEFVLGFGLRRYRAGQLLHWIYGQRASSIEEITVISRSLRASLAEEAYIGNLRLAGSRRSGDGTEKLAFELEDGNVIESVLIPDGDRLTLCVSSQAGCAMGCRFCLTGRGGLKRNLGAFEIVDQVIAAQRLASPARVTNVVLMGMGEPLHNIGEVSEALRRIVKLMGYSPRRVTLSTSGLADKMLAIPSLAPPVNLAVSLNATTDEQRSYIMPVNRRFPIKTLLEACRRYPLRKRRRITFEYVLMDSFNDTDEDARRLVKIARQVPSKVNLIPINEYEGSEFRRPPEARVMKFQEVLVAANVTAQVRKSKGSDILAACGQLGLAV